jgi:phenylacetate-CoA ligase
MALEDRLYPLLKSYTAAPQWVKRTAGCAYALLPRSLRYGSAYRIFRQEAGCPSEDLPELIERKLRRALHWALTTVPAYEPYRQLLGATSSAEALLRQLPPVTKDELKSRLPEYLSAAMPPEQRMEMFTGGSTAQPMRFYLQKHVTRSKESAYVDAWMESLGVGRRDVTLVLRGRTVPTAARPGGKLWMYDPIRRQLIFSCDHLEPPYMPGYVAPLRQWRPTFIHAFPSALYALATWLQQHPEPEVSERIQAVMLTSETVYEYQLAVIQAVFRCPIVPHYGHSERVLMAAGRPGDGRYFFWPQYGHLELLDTAGRPIQTPGVVGEIVGTAFDNHVMPFLRYRTGDFAVLSATAHPQYPRFPVCERIEGRLQEFLVCRDHRLISITTLGAAHFHLLADVREIQFEQREPGHVLLNVVGNRPLTESTTRAIAEAVERKTQGGCTLSIRQAPRIARTERGKLRMLIQHLDIRAYLAAGQDSAA